MQVWVGGIPAVEAALDRRMAVAAIDPQLTGMVLMAELGRLSLDDISAREVR